MIEPEELVKLARIMNREKAKLYAWRLRNPLSTDGIAPSWSAYKKARDKFNRAVSEITEDVNVD